MTMFDSMQDLTAAADYGNAGFVLAAVIGLVPYG